MRSGNIFILVFSFFCCSCSAFPRGATCEELESLLINDLSIETKLMSWVDSEILGLIDSYQYQYGRRSPGDFEIVSPGFDWKELGFDARRASIHIVTQGFPGLKQVHISDVMSISFSDRSRASILVKLGDSFGTDKIYTKHISGRLAIFCDENSQWGETISN